MNFEPLDDLEPLFADTPEQVLAEIRAIKTRLNEVLAYLQEIETAGNYLYEQIQEMLKESDK